MKIFSTFDTKFEKKIIAEERRKYGKKVFTIHKGKYFLWLHVLIPTIFLTLGFVLLAIGDFTAMLNVDGILKIIINVIIIIIILIFVYYGYYVLKHYIDYIMDFAVITPEQIIFYNQSGFFSRQSKSLDVDKIKTINVGKDGILRSMFNFGSIIFLSEGDSTRKGDIELYFVDNPEGMKKRILRVIGTTGKRHPHCVKEEEIE